ncbi:nitroreductase family protein [Micromonospora endophytica]|uniref:Nitroreductase n=1 Tax=Micromonospora endophytica TaxID=515350 RepID=A0A2W2D566_9ACTN|nr:nitroreductase family protein [Micromonospora endophytica]PZF95287.1 nitroreductase [Micromonospora endophytica]RIW41425.1 nitroreductase [Micromonospora endophytica]BCJ59768.1 nitroreductase [Micromonospora endophytica]
MTDLTSLLAFRWSPRSFDSQAGITRAEAATLLEAARWAPSAGNRQPWRFALGHRDDETFKRLLVNLTPADQRWAGRASALLLGAHLRTGHPFAAYDLGQAVAHLTVQATALGLHVRQVTQLDHAGLAADLDLPDGLRPYVVVAVGQLADPLSLPTDLVAEELALRHRLPLTELVLSCADVRQ